MEEQVGLVSAASVILHFLFFVSFSVGAGHFGVQSLWKRLNLERWKIGWFNDQPEVSSCRNKHTLFAALCYVAAALSSSSIGLKLPIDIPGDYVEILTLAATIYLGLGLGFTAFSDNTPGLLRRHWINTRLEQVLRKRCGEDTADLTNFAIEVIDEHVNELRETISLADCTLHSALRNLDPELDMQAIRSINEKRDSYMHKYETKPSSKGASDDEVTRIKKCRSLLLGMAANVALTAEREKAKKKFGELINQAK